MANASRDQNRIPTLLGTLNTNGTTIVPIAVTNSTQHTLSVENGISGTDYGPTDALRDENRIPVLMATSSADGTTPIAIYADSSGALLIQST